MKALTLAELIWQNYNLACEVIRLNLFSELEIGEDKELREAKEAQLLENFKGIK